MPFRQTQYLGRLREKIKDEVKKVDQAHPFQPRFRANSSEVFLRMSHFFTERKPDLRTEPRHSTLAAEGV